MKISLDRVSTVLDVVSIFLIALMISLVWVQVFTRYVFNFSFFWIEEAARYLMIWALLLSASVVIRKDKHIGVDFIIETIPPRIAKVINIFLAGLTVIFLVVFTAFGLEAAISQWDVKCSSLRCSMLWPYLILPISGFFMLVNLYVSVWERLLGEENKS